jgi:hypothetical protein
LIITRCESKNEDQCRKVDAELKEDSYFSEISSFFKLGVFFSGSLNRDDYIQGNDSLLRQFLTIMDYRNKLIHAFTTNNQPFLVTDMLISRIRQLLKEETEKDVLLKQLQHKVNEQDKLIKELNADRSGDAKTINELIEQLAKTARS